MPGHAQRLRQCLTLIFAAVVAANMHCCWLTCTCDREAARQGLEAMLSSATDADADAASLAAMHQQLAAEADEGRLQVLAQVQELAQLLRRAACMQKGGGSAQALASLRQELAWLQAVRMRVCI